jgi:hypothetical protein
MSKLQLLGLLVALMAAGAVYVIAGPDDDPAISTSQAAVPGTVKVELRGRCEGPDRAARCRQARRQKARSGNRNGRADGGQVAERDAASAPEVGAANSGADQGNSGSGSPGSGRTRGDGRGYGHNRNRGNGNSGDRDSHGEHSDSDDRGSEDDDEDEGDGEGDDNDDGDDGDEDD